MDIIRFFEDVTAKFNAENKCGFCWSFKAPLTESGMNATKLDDADLCCVKLFLTSYVHANNFVRSDRTGLERVGNSDFRFTLYAVVESEIGINVYNEQPLHLISESQIETILRPIESCLGGRGIFDLCVLPYDFDIIRWEMRPVILKDDNNYVGWKIEAIFRENV